MVDLSIFGVSNGEGKHHEEIIYSLALIYNIISDKTEHYLKNYDLSLGKMNILIAVKHHGGKEGIRQVEISKHLIVTPSNMTKMIDKLEEGRLVERLALKGDRRVNIVRITKKGSDLLDSLWGGYNETLKGFLAGLGKERQKQLSGLLVDWFEKLQ